MNPSAPPPGSQASLREMNRQRLLLALRDHGDLTQVEIAEVTGLSAATVSNMVRELDSAGAVALAPSIRNGRRAVLVSLAVTGLVAGVVFGDRDVRVAVGGGVGRVLAEKRMPLRADHAADEGMERAALLLADLVEQSGREPRELRAVGVGLPAPIDTVSRQIGADGILPGWGGLDVAAAMQPLVGAPVALDNTANLAALGELREGSLQGARNAVFVKLSYGVGAGLIVEGELYRGSSGTAGEIGHVTVDRDGPICRCGNRGCLETVIGHRAVLAALQHSHGPLTLRDVITRAVDGDPGCRRVLSDAGHHLGVALAGVVNLLNPDVVAVGGEVARVGEVVLDPLRAALERCALPSAAHTAEMRAGALAGRAEVVGSLALAERVRAEAATRLAVS